MASEAVPESTPVVELKVRPAGNAGAIEKNLVPRPVEVSAEVAVIGAPTRPVTVWVPGDSVADPETAKVMVAVADLAESENLTD